MPVNWCLLGGLIAGTAYADISLDTYLNVNSFYEQTSSVAPVTPAAFTFSVNAAEPLPPGNLPVTWTYPGPGSPQALTNDPNNGRNTFTSPQFSSLSALQAAYPFGNYTFTATSGSTIAGQATSQYNANYFPASVPALTAASYNALQGLVPNQAITVTFNNLLLNPGAQYSYTPTLYISSPGSYGGLTLSGANSVYIPAGTLAANTAYNFELVFTDFNWGGNFTPSNPFYEQEFSDVDEGSFYTVSPSPEPAYLAPLAVGMLALGLTLRKTAKRKITP